MYGSLRSIKIMADNGPCSTSLRQDAAILWLKSNHNFFLIRQLCDLSCLPAQLTQYHEPSFILSAGAHVPSIWTQSKQRKTGYVLQELSSSTKRLQRLFWASMDVHYLEVMSPHGSYKILTLPPWREVRLNWKITKVLQKENLIVSSSVLWDWNITISHEHALVLRGGSVYLTRDRELKN